MFEVRYLDLKLRLEHKSQSTGKGPKIKKQIISHKLYQI